jgi:hypothetical protein
MDMTTITPEKALEVLQALRVAPKGRVIRFSYLKDDGDLIQRQGRVIAHGAGKDGEYRVQVQISNSRSPVYKISGIIAGQEEDSRRARAARAARREPATDKQVAYALSLCGRTCPGGGNYHQPGEAGFRAMSKTQISTWISTARDELGAWA